MFTALSMVGATLASSYEASLDPQRVFAGVKVGNRDVGGLGLEQLEALAEDIAVESTRRPTRLIAGDLVG